VELTQFPSPTQSARGKVITILGREDDFGVDVEIIIRKHHLPHVFPQEALEEAREQSPVIPAAELARRRDFRQEPIVTIDGETARDFDDAVHVRRLDAGGYELQVHIADVAHFVREGTALDDEARLRGTSVYFPDRAVPMLPLELSTNLCSLRPHEDRLVLSCVMNLDRTGELTSYSLHEGVIRSAERMTYTAVQQVIDGDASARKQYSSHAEHFMLMKELAEVLNRKRMKRGSIDFDLPEPLIDFDEAGLVRGITRSERLFANRIIEEFMLAANECVASHLERRGIASLYRIHEKPDPKRIYEFEQLAATFGQSLGVGALPVQRFATRGDKRANIGSGRRTQTVEIPQEVHITPRMYQKLAMKIAGAPIERILSFLMLRSLKQAKYSELNEGHFALATPSYTHFTSPIRRYPDLIIHRILKEVLRTDEGSSQTNAVSEAEHKSSPWSKRALDNDRSQGRRLSRHQEQIAKQHRSERDGPIPERLLHDIAEESSQSERRAQDAERELMEWKKIKFMAARIGDEFDALIIGVNKFGLNVELTELFVEGHVPLVTMTADHFTFHENTRQIIGERTRRTFSLGDKVRVLLDRIDHMERRLLFAMAEIDIRPKSGGTPKGKRKKK
jgi:ribonuclease R